MIQKQDTFKLTGDEIAAKVIDGEAIIINLGTGTYYSTGDVGAFAWELAEKGHSFGAIAGALETRFQVPDGADLESELRSFVDKLIAESLVEVAPQSDGGPPMLEIASDSQPYQPPVLNAYRDMDDMLALDPPVPGLEPIPFNDPEAQR